MITIHDDKPLPENFCIFCKEPLPLFSCVTRKIGSNISEVLLDSHKTCEKKYLKIEALQHQIEKQEHILLLLKIRLEELNYSKN